MRGLYYGEPVFAGSLFFIEEVSMRHSRDGHHGVGRARASWIEALEQRAYFAADLSTTFTFTTESVKPGKTYAATIDVANNGDTTATGKLPASLELYTTGVAPLMVLESPVNKNIHIAPGGHMSFHVREKIPLGFAPGSYFGAVDLVEGIAPIVHFSTNTLNVQSLYPNEVGTFVGAGVIKKGFEKGLTFTQSVTNTSEDFATGIITFEGSDLFSNGVSVSFAGTTTVKSNGSYIANGADVPADDSIYVKDIGKYTGNQSKGTFKTAINSGTFNDTLAG